MTINKNFFLVLFSIFLSLLFIEVFFILKNFNINKNFKFSLHEHRFMLFEEGLVFNNIDRIFKYHPNKKILSKTYYKINDNWLKEYNYEIITNNFGLVQKNNIKKNTPSILFLGDSFVEGQGSIAWLNKFKGNYEKFQIINGGIMGTGPQQFELLEKHISKDFQVDKVVFLYIGDDLRRNIFNISKKTLSCLKNHKNCKGDENFYGFPFKDKNPTLFLDYLNEFRLKQKKNISFYEKIKLKIKKNFLNLYTVKIINNYIKQKFYFSKNEYIQRNFKSIKNLYDKYENSILFIQIRNKNEIIYGKEYDTFYAEKFIKQLTDKHFICNFKNDITNFHTVDMHPNKKGYNYLHNCVKQVLQKHL